MVDKTNSEIQPCNYRYVNLVLQGGGTLGIAHVGAIAELEEMGFRFVGLAGASAGAIVALLIAASRENIDDTCADQLKAILEALPAADFVDGPYHVRKVIKHLIPARKPTWSDLLLLPGIAAAVRILISKGGLNSGDVFFDWLDKVLRDQWDISTINDLRRRIEGTLRPLYPEDLDWTKFLVLTATALPIGIKMEFPRDLKHLGPDWDTSSPALMARASMSIPAFFTPLSLSVHRSRWSQFVDERVPAVFAPTQAEEAKALSTLTLVDGGLLSNFPIDAFSRSSRENPESPEIPTYGVSLSSSTDSYAVGEKGLRKILAAAGQMIGAARATRDREAKSRLRKEDRLISVDTGLHNWLDFSLEDEALEDLYHRGRRAVKTELNSKGEQS